MVYWVSTLLIAGAAAAAYFYGIRRQDRIVRAELAEELSTLRGSVEKKEKISKQLRQESADLSYQLSNANKSVRSLELQLQSNEEERNATELN